MDAPKDIEETTPLLSDEVKLGAHSSLLPTSRSKAWNMNDCMVETEQTPRLSSDESQKAKGMCKRMMSGAHNMIHRGSPEDAMTYHTADLSSWTALSVMHQTVWSRWSLWRMAITLFAMSTFVAILTALCIKDPENLQSGKFLQISSFLNVFVGMLLGFFMSASVNRWWQCAGGFMGLCDAIRSLQMQLSGGLGVANDKTERVLRYGVLSAWILSFQLRAASVSDPELKEKTLADMWNTLRNGLEDRPLVIMELEEYEIMSEVEDPAEMMWMWVSSLVGRFAKDGDIPGMATPTYGRIMNLVQNAFASIRVVRSAITVQAPYIYVQMLASLVHINNIINALSFGMTMGAIGKVPLSHLMGGPATEKVTSSEVADLTRNFIMSFFFSCVGPFVYQALLEVSIAIAQPFSGPDGSIPVWRLLQRLEYDLRDGEKVLEKELAWKKARFKD